MRKLDSFLKDGKHTVQVIEETNDKISRVRPIYWLADISADIFCQYQYIGIGKLVIGIGHIGIG